MSLVCAAVVSDPCPSGLFAVVFVSSPLNSNITSFMLLLSETPLTLYSGRAASRPNVADDFGRRPPALTPAGPAADVDRREGLVRPAARSYVPQRSYGRPDRPIAHWSGASYSRTCGAGPYRTPVEAQAGTSNDDETGIINRLNRARTSPRTSGRRRLH